MSDTETELAKDVIITEFVIYGLPKQKESVIEGKKTQHFAPQDT